MEQRTLLKIVLLKDNTMNNVSKDQIDKVIFDLSEACKVLCSKKVIKLDTKESRAIISAYSMLKLLAKEVE